MYVKDALKFYRTRAGIYHALEGEITRSAIYQWKEDELIPFDRAMSLFRKAGGKVRMRRGKLKLNFKLYDRARARRSHTPS